jgi:branched-chain amino acid transport system ATP-binding protein
VKAVRDVSLTVERGAIVALLGPNGAGKTTTLRVTSGLLRAFEGEVLLDGKEITNLPAHQRAKLGICHVPEGRGIHPTLTVKDNLILATPGRRDETVLEEALALFPILGDRMAYRAGTLSGGQQQMLALSRTIISKPRVVLVDEASLGLAPVIVDQIFEFFGTLRSRGTAVLMVEQYVHRALAISDHVYLMDRGGIAAEGSPSELRETELVDAYVGKALE